VEATWRVDVDIVTVLGMLNSSMGLVEVLKLGFEQGWYQYQSHLTGPSVQTFR
jgi:hypothetical protein